jgi:hypothetical protein
VLGAPDQVADAVRELEQQGVMVGRIVVTTAFDHLLDAERDALLDVERSSGIRLELIAERLGLQGSDVPRPDSVPASAGETAVTGTHVSPANRAALDVRHVNASPEQSGSGEWAAAPGRSLTGAGTEKVASVPF